MTATMRRRRRRSVLVAAVAFVVLAPAAGAARVAVVVVPRFEPAQYGHRGAVGLLVPGAGSTVTHAGALSSLVRGKVVNSVLGGRASGPPLVRLVRQPGPITIYVALPPPGRHRNVTRYPIAVVGGGYRGLLTSHGTRIPGLVSIADVAPTAVALEQGTKPTIGWRDDRDPASTLARLDARLRRAHDNRTAATVVLVASVLTLAGLALLLRSALVARAALLGSPAALITAFALSASRVDGRWVATAGLAAGTVGLALLGARPGARMLRPLLLGFLCLAIVALAVWPETNALALIGPHPDGGGRYFGVTNELETLLLAPIITLGVLVPVRAMPLVVVLALALVGWSRTGADGGGVLVVVVALVALWGFRTGLRWTPRRVVAAAALVVALGLVAVGVDALTGGSSHVTHALGRGPLSLAGEVGHRLHASWAGLTATTQATVSTALTLVGLVGVGLLRLRSDLVDALLVALAVSLLVNDTAVDVIAYGALVCAALRTWEELDPRAPMRRSVAALSPRVLPAPRSR